MNTFDDEKELCPKCKNALVSDAQFEDLQIDLCDVCCNNFQRAIEDIAVKYDKELNPTSTIEERNKEIEKRNKDIDEVAEEFHIQNSVAHAYFEQTFQKEEEEEDIEEDEDEEEDEEEED